MTTSAQARMFPTDRRRVFVPSPCLAPVPAPASASALMIDAVARLVDATRTILTRTSESGVGLGDRRPRAFCGDPGQRLIAFAVFVCGIT